MRRRSPLPGGVAQSTAPFDQLSFVLPQQLAGRQPLRSFELLLNAVISNGGFRES
jgi:hypothetical protein